MIRDCIKLQHASVDGPMPSITLKKGALKDDGRPDIALIFSSDPENEKVDVVVFEIKRMADDEKENSFAVTSRSRPKARR